jgi:hypothetical protein
MRRVRIRAGSLTAAMSVIYAAYAMHKESVTSASVSSVSESDWPVIVVIDGPNADRAWDDLLIWATGGTVVRSH